MSSVFRLVYGYFAATPITRALTLGGIVLCVIAVLGATYLPQWQYAMAFSWPGQLALVAGAAHMPAMFARLAQGHALRFLPLGRLKLLASAFFTVLLVVLPALLFSPYLFSSGIGSSLSEVQKLPGAAQYLLELSLVIYTESLLLVGWLYLILYFLTSHRGYAGVAKAMLLIAVAIFKPARELQELSANIQMNLVQFGITWSLFGAGFLCWPRLKSFLPGRSGERRSAASGDIDTWGKEIPLILGTSNPWQFVGGLILPLAIASRFRAGDADVWLLVLTLFSALSGATAGQAASRTRALWLRRPGSRRELFGAVERAFWRHNAIILAVLLATMVAAGNYLHLPGAMLATALPLMVLASVLSTYLGLFLTRGMRWPEITLGAVVVLSLIGAALMLSATPTRFYGIFGIEAVLLGVALWLRAAARSRWSRIDWMECRPQRTLVLRGA